MSFSYNLNGEVYKYNSIRQVNENDEVQGVLVDSNGNQLAGVNTSVVGGGFIDTSFGLVLCRPSNATGFDSFVWNNYFDSVMITPAVREPVVDTVEEQIGQLPDPTQVTLADNDKIFIVRSAYDRLTNAQRDFVDETLVAKLVACEEALAKLGGTSTPVGPITPDPSQITNGDAVKTLIDNLPAFGADVSDDELANAIAAAQAAKAAYNALSDSEKAKVTNLDMLTAYEKKIEEQTGSPVKPLVPSEDNGGGLSVGTLFIGVVIGLAVAAAACLITLMVIRKKRAKN